MNSRFSPGTALTGILFVVLGVLFFLDAIDAIRLRLDVLLPIGVIALGVAVLLGAIWDHRGERAR
jgi:hypothetical protein